MGQLLGIRGVVSGICGETTFCDCIGAMVFFVSRRAANFLGVRDLWGHPFAFLFVLFLPTRDLWGH